MARPLRVHVPNGFYHVTLRGNHRQDIFRTFADRELLDRFVDDAAHEHDARVHAYCWMTNHIHAVIQVSDTPLGEVIRCIASRYARRFQWNIGTTGHLFERRHHAILVDADDYLQTLLRYLHLNPVRAGLCADPADYPWSSHRDYLGLRRTPWLHTRFALQLFAQEPVLARARYAEWMGAKDETRWGQGLLVPHPDNPLVMGNDCFLARILEVAGGKHDCGSLTDLLEECARKHGLSSEAITSTSRSRGLTAARIWLYQEAVGRGVASISEIARRCRRSESAVRSLMLRYRSTVVGE